MTNETRSVVANYANLGTAAAMFALLTPVILASVGPTAYGYWVILNALGGYFLLADVGLSAAVARYTAVHRASGSPESLSRLLSTLSAVCLGGVLLVLAATALAAPAIVTLFHVPADLAPAATPAFVLTGINAAVVLLTFFVASVNYGYGRLDVSRGASIVGQLATAGATLSLLWDGHGIVGLAAATLAGTLITLSVNALYARSAYRTLVVSPMRFDLTAFQDTWQYGLRTFVLSVTNRAVNYTDAIVIGVFVGATAVASYELTYKVCFFATYLFSSVSTAAFPRFSALTQVADAATVRAAYLRVVRISMLIAVPLGICLAAFLRPFLELWAGADMFAGNGVLVALMGLHLLHAIGTPGVMFLQGAGRNRELMHAEIANAVLNVALSIALVVRFGVAGAICGTLIAHLCSTFWVIQRLPARMLEMRLSDYWKTAVLGPLAIGAPAALAAIVITSTLAPLHTFVRLMTSCGVVLAIYGLTYLASSTFARSAVATSEDSSWPIQSAS